MSRSIDDEVDWDDVWEDEEYDPHLEHDPEWAEEEQRAWLGDQPSRWPIVAFIVEAEEPI